MLTHMSLPASYCIFRHFHPLVHVSHLFSIDIEQVSMFPEHLLLIPTVNIRQATMADPNRAVRD